MRIKVPHNDLKAAIFAALLFIIQFACVPAGATSKSVSGKMTSCFENPDFAFPKTVESDASPRLADALKSKNGIEALKAAIQVVVARNQVSMSDFNTNVALLDSAASVMPAPYSQLFYLLEATSFRQLYEDNAWVYNQRVLPTDSFPSDPLSWSRDLFCKKVIELTDKAVDDDDTAKKMPIKEISGVLVDSEGAEKYGLSVYDFIVYSCVENLKALGRGSSEKIIPFAEHSDSNELSYPEMCNRRAGALLSRLYDYREKAGNIAALTVAIDWKAKDMDGAEGTAFLKEWKERLILSEWDARLLDAYFKRVRNDRQYSASDKKRLYDDMSGWLKEFPEAYNADVVKYDLSLMSQSSVKVQSPGSVLPLTPGKGEMTLNNVNKAFVLIYKVPESMVDVTSLKMSKFPTGCKLIASVEVDAAGEVPFESKREFEIPSLPAGRYVLIPSDAPQLKPKWKYEVDLWSVGIMNVSDISVFSTSDSSKENSGLIYVVDSRNQKPVEGASVTFYDNGGRKVGRVVKTDSKGAVAMPQGYYKVKARKGSSIAESWLGSTYRRPDTRERVLANILTDLSIYKPGAKVGFALVGWTTGPSGNALLKNKMVRAILRDANYNVVDSVSMTTDEFGRCDSHFVLPESGLLGTYRIEASFPGLPGATAGRAAFEVAEYKAPAFFVSLNADSTRSFKAGEVIRFVGSVKTYSGMPVGGSKVTFNVRWSPWWRIWSGSNPSASYGGILETDEKGEFEISLPTDNLKHTEFEFGTYTIEASATSPSGETQQSLPVRFSLGDEYNINPDLADNICISGEEVSLNIPVYDMLGLPAVKEVEYRLTDKAGGRTVAEGRFESPVLKIVSTLIPSGRYEISLNLPGDTLKTEREIVFWRKDDNKAPYETPLWVPERNIVAGEGEESVEIAVGSGYAGSWILATVSDTRGDIIREWIKIDGDNRSYTVKTPGEDGRVWVSFLGMHDFIQDMAVVSVVPQSALRKLKVKTETFRDKISAGEKEQWRFRFDVDSVAAANIPVFAVMTDKSLNALSPFAWNLNLGRRSFYNTFNFTPVSYSDIYVSGQFSHPSRFHGLGDAIPLWNTYGYNLGNTGRNFAAMRSGVKSVRQMTMTRGTSSETVMAEESASAPMFMAVEQKMMNAAPADMKAEAAMADGAAMTEKDAVESPDPGGAAGGDTQLRQIEMPLAFFYPALKSDDKGSVAIDFETPNFNTTWQFQILGYTEELLTAGLIKDAVASKPVMVRSNPPRYLRTGDRGEIMAMIFNNTGHEADLSGELVILDPSTGKPLASRKFEREKVAPSGSRVMTLEWEVPSDISAVALRAYAFGDSHSDGEQTLIPILPSSTPVVESVEFYLGAGKMSFEKKLPKFRKDANVTLKYCNNPIWECVMALPSISSPDSKNVLTLMKALYANSTALEIVRKYPAIKEGLEKALSSDNDSVLKSNLEQDASLKTVTLTDTPWVNNAASETERMRSLNSLLDIPVAQESVERLMKDVKALQNADGGWSWCEGMRSSVFMTRRVLESFGMMKKSGAFPEGADKMVRDGVAYCDRKALEDYNKSDKRFSTSDMLSYLYVRSFFNAGSGPSGFRILKEAALKKISEEWESLSVYQKSIAAVLLSRSKGYEKTAGMILESLSQYASKSESKGWWFDNLRSGFGGWSKLAVTASALEAYNEISPASPAVDGLRQWLVLQKETEDWGRNSNTVEVVSAILSGGSDWTGESPAPTVTLDGRRLPLPEGNMPTGSVTIPIDAKSASGKVLIIEKMTEGPSWGGIVSQYVAPIKDVKGERCENLKIEKKLLVVKNTAVGEKASAGEIKVGDKVRVTLTVTCDKDMSYVALIDERGACLEPVDQMSGYSYKDGLGMYREVRESKTSFFIEFLPKGVNVITYDCHADREGKYAVGIASVQSQYSPLQTAHSAGAVIVVGEK